MENGMSEHDETRLLANKILDRPSGDPDDDLGMLSRQLLRADEETARLKRFLAIRDRQTIQAEGYWVRAAKKALDGDTRELRLRVEISEAPPVKIVQSAPTPQ